MSADRLDQLSEFAHLVWCDRMRAEGWRTGPQYNSARRIHDAMVPYRDLAPGDRMHTRVAAQASGVLELLARCIHYPRGLDAATPIEQLAVSRHVRLIKSDRVEGIEVKRDDIGVVEQVEREEGRVVRVAVRWPSGDQTIHGEDDGDLALVPTT